MSVQRSKVRNARMLFIDESEYGVPDFGTPDATPGEVLAAEANPGAESLEFDADVSGDVGAGDIIEVGREDKDDIEYYEVDSGYSSGAEVDLNAKSPVIFKREPGYKLRVFDKSTMKKFKRLPGFIGTTLNPDIPLLQSGELTGHRGVADVRNDVVRISGDINLQIGLEHSGAALRTVLNKIYYQDAEQIDTPAADTLGSAATAGAASIAVDAVPAGWETGDVVKIADPDAKKVELVKISDSWDEVATTIPLDAETPLMYAHDSGVAVQKVKAPYTHIIDAGDSIPSTTYLVHFADSGVVGLFRGIKVNVMNMTVNANNGLLTATLSVIGKAVQIFDDFIFADPTTYPHKPFTNWETVMRQDGVILPGITEHAISINNMLETDGFEHGSRFIGSADEDRGDATGSFNYKFKGNDRIKDIYFEQERALRFITSYKGASSQGEAFEVELPKARFGGSAFPQVPATGFISGQNPITALYDSTLKTDVRVKVTNSNVRI